MREDISRRREFEKHFELDDGMYMAVSYSDPALKDPVTGNQLIFTYMHMKNAPSLRVGDSVTKGSTIVGKLGNTGGSTGPHLHFEAQNSGTVWGPGTTKATRVYERINPFFFYPVGRFTFSSNQIDRSYIWDEIMK